MEIIWDTNYYQEIKNKFTVAFIIKHQHYNYALGYAIAKQEMIPTINVVLCHEFAMRYMVQKLFNRCDHVMYEYNKFRWQVEQGTVRMLGNVEFL